MGNNQGEAEITGLKASLYYDSGQTQTYIREFLPKKFREILGNVPRGFGKSSERFWEMFREIKRKPPELSIKSSGGAKRALLQSLLEGAK